MKNSWMGDLDGWGRRIGILVLLLVSIWINATGLQWGFPHYLHPDERRMILSTEGFPSGTHLPFQNPNGPLPFLLLKGTQDLLSLPFEGEINGFVVGRFLALALGILTIFLTYALGRDLFGPAAGLAAAFLTGFTPIHIQESHVFTEKGLFVCLMLFALVFSAKALRSGRLRYWIASGGILGLGAATRIDLALLLPAILLSSFLRESTFRPGKGTFVKKSIFPSWLGSPLFLVSFLALFTAGNIPYLFSPGQLADNLSQQIRSIWFQSMVPHWMNHHPGEGIFRMVRDGLWWSFGPPLGALLFLAGIGWGGAGWSKKLWGPEGLILFSALFLILSVLAMADPKPIELYPLLPLLLLLAARSLLEKLEAGRHSAAGPMMTSGVLVLLVLSVVQGISFVRIYTLPDSRVQASDWIYENVPEGKTILAEFGPEEIPLDIPPHSRGRYVRLKLNALEKDGEDKIGRISQSIHRADVLVLSGKQTMQTVLENPQRYPFTASFYRLLFKGSLGFRLVETFANRPLPSGIGWGDDSAHPLFTDPDHPRVFIFRKMRSYTPEEYKSLLSMPVQSVHGPSNRQIYAAEVTRRGIAPLGEALEAEGRSKTAWIVVKWLAISELLGLLMFPLLFSLFPHAPDRGYAQAKTLGLLAVGYVSWLISSLGWLPFGIESILWACLVLLGFGLWQVSGAWGEMLEFLRKDLSRLLLTEAVFLFVFALFLTIRSYNPEIYWGEKPMDFSFLNLLNRTETFPPEEPWFSGTPMNYYYMGYLLTAVLEKLGSIPSSYAYNLMMGLIPALVGISLFGLFRSFADRAVFGILGVLLVILSGNLDGIYQFWAKRPPLDFNYYWATSRVIPNTINEYPFWSFLFSDLHAHVFAMILIPVAVFLFSRVFLDPGGTFRYFLAGPLFPKWFLFPLVLGSFSFMNSWDYPVYVSLFALFLLVKWIGRSGENRGKGFLSFILDVVVPGGVFVGLSYVWMIPFHSGFEPQSIYVGRVVDGWAKAGEVLRIFGFFLLAFLIFSLQRFHRFGTRVLERRMIFPAGVWSGMAIFLAVAATVGLGYVAFGLEGLLPLGGLAVYAVAVVLWLAMVLCGKLERLELMLAVLVLLAFSLGAYSELFFVNDRMNTVFKFYVSAWYFLSIPSVYFLRQALLSMKVEEPSDGESLPHALFSWGLRLFVGAVVFLGIVSVLFCSVTVTRGLLGTHRVQTDVPTVDGTNYLKYKNPEEYEAIRWLIGHVSGTPVLLEAQGAPYQDFSRITMNTGIPNVLGWEHHVFQRGKSRLEIDQRKEAVQVIYDSPRWEDVLPFVRYYGIDYIFVGDLERRTYSPQGLAKFQEVLPAVFENDRVRIYSVPESIRAGIPEDPSSSWFRE